MTTHLEPKLRQDATPCLSVGKVTPEAQKLLGADGHALRFWLLKERLDRAAERFRDPTQRDGRMRTPSIARIVVSAGHDPSILGGSATYLTDA
ncbi:hypothetical protein ACLBX9_29975 [Methylobacterium sp. A49B]